MYIAYLWSVYREREEKCAMLSHFSDAFIRSGFTFNENACFYVFELSIFFLFAAAHTPVTSVSHEIKRKKSKQNPNKTEQTHTYLDIEIKIKKSRKKRPTTRSARLTVIRADHNITTTLEKSRDNLISSVTVVWFHLFSVYCSRE